MRSIATKYQASLPDLPKVLFWDIEGQTPDYANHSEWVINRVFSYGSLEDIAEIILYYGEGKIKDVLTNEPWLSKEVLYLASAILDVPLNHFKCYIRKQFRKSF